MWGLEAVIVALSQYLDNVRDNPRLDLVAEREIISKLETRNDAIELLPYGLLNDLNNLPLDATLKPCEIIFANHLAE